MLLPSIFGENLLEDWFPPMKPFNFERRIERVMKTDIKESDNGYEMDVELPGYKKEEIAAHIDNGCLVITAEKTVNKDDKNKEGKVIRQERYVGSMTRRFYVGDDIKEEDIKAKFEDGILKISVPKKEAPQVEEKKTIAIE